MENFCITGYKAFPPIINFHRLDDFPPNFAKEVLAEHYAADEELRRGTSQGAVAFLRLVRGTLGQLGSIPDQVRPACGEVSTRNGGLLSGYLSTSFA